MDFLQETSRYSDLTSGVTMTSMAKVWLVWTVSAEFEENASRNLDGIFETKQLAEEFAAQLKSKASKSDDIEVTEENILRELPVTATYHRWSAHVSEAGQDLHLEPYSPGLVQLQEIPGPDKRQYTSWKYPGSPDIDSRDITLWHGPSSSERDLYIEVRGTDLAAVQFEYNCLLGEARSRLGL